MENYTDSRKGMLTGMFLDGNSTEKAYKDLQDRGYSKDEINLIMSDRTREKYFSGENADTEIGTKAAEGAGTGTAIGGTIGAVVGIVAALGTSLAIPGLGLLIAGPIAAGLAGAGAGGIAGSIIGALVGWGIPEDRAKYYESGINDGKIVMGVHPRNEADAEYFGNAWNVSKNENSYV